MSKSTRTRTAPATPAPEAKVATKPAPSNCRCGCGQPTVTAKATFVAGHDARLAGRLGRALAVNPKDEAALKVLATLTDRLQAKVEGVRVTAVKKAAAKEAREVAKAAAKAAYEKALADATK